MTPSCCVIEGIVCLQARPSFQKTSPPHWKDSPNQDWLNDL